MKRLVKRRPYPHSGTCAYCERERDDLFWHPHDRAFYCADVFRCEARWEILCDRRIAAEASA